MKAGIFNNISIDEYHAEKEWYSSTGLKMAKKSLKLFYLFLQGYFEDVYKSHFGFGNAFELALLDKINFETKVANEVDIFNDIYEANKDTKSPRSTSLYKSWLDEQIRLKKYIVKDDGKESFRVIEEMLKSCYADAVIQKLIQGIEYNYTLCWIDKETGLQLKTRPDICKIKKNIIVNLKTTVDGSPEGFAKECAKFDYPFQACMEIDGVISTGFMERVDNYFWLVVEKEPPFSATIYEFDQEDIKDCFEEYRYTLKNVAESKKTGLYPSYSQRADNRHGILTVKLPLWYKRYGL